MGAERLRLQWRPYRFELPRTLITSQGAWNLRRGWLLRLEAEDGRLGWGEAALAPAPEPRTSEAAGHTSIPVQHQGSGSPAAGRADRRASSGDPTSRGGSDDDPEARELVEAVRSLPSALLRAELEAALPALLPPLACALGMALAELDGLGGADQGGWLIAPSSALLLPAGEAALTALQQALTADEPPAGDAADEPGQGRAAAQPERLSTRPQPDRDADAQADRSRRRQGRSPSLTVKWKVASGDDSLERRVLEALLLQLPADGRLRLDANGGWDRATAWRWAERLAGENRLEWLEQPLAAGDRDGLEALAQRLPLALDESLRHDPTLMAGGWRGWQVRRPLLEADPRPLLEALRTGAPRLMLSTAFETGIGRRLLHHLAGLQALGPTPTAPGLAPGWRPGGPLFSQRPETVWEAAE